MPSGDCWQDGSNVVPLVVGIIVKMVSVGVVDEWGFLGWVGGVGLDGVVMMVVKAIVMVMVVMAVEQVVIRGCGCAGGCEDGQGIYNDGNRGGSHSDGNDNSHKTRYYKRSWYEDDGYDKMGSC